MKEKIIAYLKYGNRFCGIEHTQKGGKDILYGSVLKRKNKQLDLETSFETESIDGLKSLIPRGRAINLVINNSSVLTKRVISRGKEVQKIVYEAFPNIKIEDFYFQAILTGKYSFVSICRKSYVDDLLNKYQVKGLLVIDFTLGNLICSTLVEFLDLPKVESSNAVISLENKTITDITFDGLSSTSNYTLNGLDIKNNELLSFAGALNLLLKDQTLQSSFSDLKKELNIAFNQKQFASQFPKIVLSTLFIILLINFLFFNHYYNEVNTLRETALVVETSKEKLLLLNEKVEKTEKMVNDVLKSSSSKSSFYVNDIVKELPDHILLKEFNYQPLLKRIKEGKPIDNQKNVILISGQTNKQALFSQWISKLENKSWISSIDIFSFEDSNNNLSNFTIKLNMDATEN
jgi:hypothetical protein